MKTAMQELKERMITIGFTNVDEFIDPYIEKEKQQIIDARENGIDAGINDGGEDHENYYNETFKND